jgi:hypothetical protein
MATLLALADPIQGTVFHLGAEEVTIGRQSSSQLCIGDISVSRQHCLIRPAGDGFQIQDLRSNNGTFVNGRRVDESALAHGDKIRIGDTVLVFSEEEDESAEQNLTLPDNGLIARSLIQTSVQESADTAIRRLFVSIPQNSGFATRARSFLKIGARLNASQEPGTLEAEILKCILEAGPADQGAIVLSAESAGSAPTIVGWGRLSETNRFRPREPNAAQSCHQRQHRHLQRRRHIGRTIERRQRPGKAAHRVCDRYAIGS